MSVVSGEYNEQQREALLVAIGGLAGLSFEKLRQLRRGLDEYLQFREETARFQQENFAQLCTHRCFTDGTSACCGREGILAFFADVVVNALLSTEKEAERLLSALREDRGGPNCVYLGEEGCLWRLKPVVCEMFLCDRAKETALGGRPALQSEWEGLRRRERLFTFPDRPVLFDEIEKLFLEEGHESPLMYFHRSPGLLRLKAKHGLGAPLIER